jgi:tRNA (guanine26-N2/guanine27-N2)-dimethyltransferase
MYGGPLHNVGFIERVLAQLNDVDRETYPTKDRIEGMLHTALEEITFGAKTEKESKTKELDPIIPKTDPAEIDHNPFFFIPSALARVVHCQAPPLAAVRGALRRAGYRATMSHCKPGSVRTDAPWSAVWHTMLEWIRQKAPLKNQLKKESAGAAILLKSTQQAADTQDSLQTGEGQPLDPGAAVEKAEPDIQSGAQQASTAGAFGIAPSYQDMNFEVVFDENLGKDHDRGKYVRYQTAPRENWGPMARAK